MSSAGWIVSNDTGNLVIDSQSKNLALRYKGYVTSAQGTPTGGSQYMGIDMAYDRVIQIPLSVRNPVIAIRPDSSSAPSSPFGDWSSAPNLATLSHMASLGGDLYQFEFWYRGAFTYYVFDEPQAPSDADGAGLRVWNERGELCFSSAFQYMRIVSSFVGSFDMDGAYARVNHVPEPPGKAYALVQSKSHSQEYKVGEPVEHQKYGIVTTSSFVLRSPGFGIGLVMGIMNFSGYFFFNQQVIPGLGTFLKGSSLLVDVTGY